MSYKITTRQTKAGTAFDLYVRWKDQRYRLLLGYNLTKEQADEAAIAMIAKIQSSVPLPTVASTDGPCAIWCRYFETA